MVRLRTHGTSAESGAAAARPATAHDTAKGPPWLWRNSARFGRLDLLLDPWDDFIEDFAEAARGLEPQESLGLIHRGNASLDVVGIGLIRDIAKGFAVSSRSVDLAPD